MRPELPVSLRRIPKLLLCLAVASWPALGIASATVTFRDGVSPPGYAGTRDVYVSDGAGDAWQPNVNYNSVGLEVVGGGTQKASLMRWDVSSIPAGSTVTAASITLEITNGSAARYFIYECLRPWAASQATWNQYATGQAWATPGGDSTTDHGSTALELDPFTTLTTGQTTFRLNASGVAVVQSWVDDPARNHGVLIPAGADPDGMNWHPSEVGTPSWRPRLTVTYSGNTTVSFQNGVAPTAGYAGQTDTVIAIGPDPKTVNNNAGWLNTDASPNHAYSLISFDLSSIPSWATVNSASLSFHIGDSSAGTFTVQEMLRPWDENGATWFEYRSGSAWASPGGQGATDHGALVLATYQPSGASVSFALNPDGIALVQAWVSGTRPNRGFMLGNPTEGDGVWMADREEPVLADRPAFTVDYTEGQLVLTLGSGPPGGPFPVTVSRQRLDGTPLSLLAPALDVTLSSPSPTGGFSTNPIPGFPTTPTATVQIPAGLPSTILPVYFFEPADGTPTVTASAGPAWNDATQSAVVTDGGTPDNPDAGSDGGVDGKPDAGTDGGRDAGSGGNPDPLQLRVGCGTPGGTSAAGLVVLGLAAALWLSRRVR